MTFSVKLDVFEGPIDLLLHLITRQRVDIYEVSIGAITDEYLQVLRGMEGLDLETATGFLVIAATLLELKSARLLPGREDADEDALLLEARDLLLARLVECSTYRQAGSWLQTRLEVGVRSHPRRVALEPWLAELAPTPEVRVGADELVMAAARVFTPAPPGPQWDISHLAPIRASVRDAIIEIAARLSGSGSATFAELCGHQRSRIEVVVRFLGLLELFKAGAVDLRQQDRFGTIEAYWTDESSVDEALADAEEYTLATREGK